VASAQLTPVKIPDDTFDATSCDVPHVPDDSTAYIGTVAPVTPTATQVDAVAQLTALKCPVVEGVAMSTGVPHVPEVSET
jgi:hypothetical protein